MTSTQNLNFLALVIGASGTVLRISLNFLVQVADQRSAVREEGAAEEDIAPWMSGEEVAPGEEASEAYLDAETEHLLRTQREYYDSVHVIREKARSSCPCCSFQ